jgi:hypothetical protein
MIVVVTEAMCEAQSKATVGQRIGYCSINPEALRQIEAIEKDYIRHRIGTSKSNIDGRY